MHMSTAHYTCTHTQVHNHKHTQGMNTETAMRIRRFWREVQTVNRLRDYRPLIEKLSNGTWEQCRVKQIQECVPLALVADSTPHVHRNTHEILHVPIMRCTIHGMHYDRVMSTCIRIGIQSELEHCISSKLFLGVPNFKVT